MPTAQLALAPAAAMMRLQQDMLQHLLLELQLQRMAVLLLLSTPPAAAEMQLHLRRGSRTAVFSWM
jgi:hypothetical protein